jgi:putative membrane protein
MGLIIRTAITALAVWLATLVIPGITLGTEDSSAVNKIFTALIVAVIFGLVNAILRPIIKVVGCWAYVLTLGLIALIVNGALLMLTSWIAGKLDLAFHVDKFWWHGVAGALFISVVATVLNWFVPDRDKKKVVYRDRR